MDKSNIRCRIIICDEVVASNLTMEQCLLLVKANMENRCEDGWFTLSVSSYINNDNYEFKVNDNESIRHNS